jgi:hypothetical protein
VADEPRCTLTATSTCLCTGRAGCLAADDDTDDVYDADEYDPDAGLEEYFRPEVTIQPSEAYL